MIRTLDGLIGKVMIVSVVSYPYRFLVMWLRTTGLSEVMNTSLELKSIDHRFVMRCLAIKPASD